MSGLTMETTGGYLGSRQIIVVMYKQDLQIII